MKTKIKIIFYFLFLITLLFYCNKYETIELPKLPDGVQAISLLGDTLRTPTFTKVQKEKLEKNLNEANEALVTNPSNAGNIIWLGRRTAYLGEYREAIKIYTEGINSFPKDARLYRHRGHRFISLRSFNAINDLEFAASLIKGTKDEIEPDGIPNARNIPTSTLHSNIWYHLGLAYYLKGDFDRALIAYQECLQVSANPDMLVATSHWLYMTLRRLGKNDQAAQVLQPLHAEMDIIENISYHKLLLMYKEEIVPASILDEDTNALDNATLGYGVGNWYFYNGQKQKAQQIFQNILQGDQWAAFGYIAAEAELERMK